LNLNFIRVIIEHVNNKHTIFSSGESAAMSGEDVDFIQDFHDGSYLISIIHKQSKEEGEVS